MFDTGGGASVDIKDMNEHFAAILEECGVDAFIIADKIGFVVL